MTQLTRTPGGSQLCDPLKTFYHSIPAGSSPREIWPALVAFAAALFLLDVAVRRLRLALIDLRRWGYDRGASLLGRAQAVTAPAPARLRAAQNRIGVRKTPVSGRAR